MLRIPSTVVLWSLLAAHAAGQETGLPHVLPREANQHLLVVTDADEAVRGRLVRVERGRDGWRTVGEAVSVVVGRSGVGPKREGDGRSPRGIFELGPAFGYAPEGPAGLKIPYRPMAPGAVCVDDSASRHYNRIVHPEMLSGPADWESAEAMRRDLAHGDALYRWGVEVEYNPDQVPGAGSCIFLHVWRGPRSPTVGCTAMAEADLLEVMRWLRPEDRPVLIQGTRAFLEKLGKTGELPYPVPGSL